MISRRLVQFCPSDKPKTSQTRGPEMASSVEVVKGLRYPWQLQRHRASNEGYRDLSEEVTQASQKRSNHINTFQPKAKDQLIAAKSFQKFKHMDSQFNQPNKKGLKYSFYSMVFS